MSRIRRLLGACMMLTVAYDTIRAQSVQNVHIDTLRLADALALAVATDARAAQASMLQRQSALRRTTIRNSMRPSLRGAASAQYLSDVARIALPGAAVPGPVQQQYDANVAVVQPLLDPTRRPRLVVEQARLAEAEAQLESSLWQQRTQVNDAFFALLRLDDQQRTIEQGLTDLRERQRVADQRVSAGQALPSELLVLNAEIARREQSRQELITEAAAYREVLSSLIGRDVPENAVLMLPTTLFAAQPLPAPGSNRPEFERFARSRALIEAQDALLAARDRPRVSLMGRAGYGRPGLNQLGRDFDSYYVAGVEVHWSPFNWGSTSRERTEQAISAEIVASNEQAFREQLQRVATTERARVNALEQSLAADEQIITLRERIMREMRLRYDEGEVPSAEYVSRLSELLTAQLERDLRRTRLAEARARYLTTIGLEIR